MKRPLILLLLVLSILIIVLILFMAKEPEITKPAFLQSDTIDITPTKKSIGIVKNDKGSPANNPRSKNTSTLSEANGVASPSTKINHEKINENKDEVEYLTYEALKESLSKTDCGWEDKSARTECFENIKDYKSDGLKFIEENFEELEALREKYHNLLVIEVKTTFNNSFESMKLKIEGEHWAKRKFLRRNNLK